MPRGECDCRDCVALRQRRLRLRSPSPSRSPVRINRADLLYVSDARLRRPRFFGRVYNVAIARNFAGIDAGELCVTKWVRDEFRRQEAQHYHHTIQNSQLLARIVQCFNNDGDMKDWTVLVNVPRLWKSGTGRNVLVDKYVPDWKTLVGGKGCRRDCGRTYMKLLEAICHYSYVRSQGKWMITKLQGGVNEERKVMVIGDCRISTVGRKGERGWDDNGLEQVRRFFRYHECSSLCRGFPKLEERRTFFTPVHSEEDEEEEEDDDIDDEEEEEEDDRIWWH